MKDFLLNHLIEILSTFLATASIYIGVKKRSIKQNQKSGNDSKNFQATGNITINGNIND